MELQLLVVISSLRSTRYIVNKLPSDRVNKTIKARKTRYMATYTTRGTYNAIKMSDLIFGLLVAKIDLSLQLN